jgi:hypothetical protein
MTPKLDVFVKIFVAAVFIVASAAFLMSEYGVDFERWLTVSFTLLAMLGLYKATPPGGTQ